jgi:predicted lipoprotein with Yx(FWY)xxD motif
MKRLIAPGIAIGAALAISACGGGGGSAGTSGATPAASGGAGISVKQLSGVGRVLVDGSGKPLYTPNLEAGGKIVCAGGCTAFWQPVAATGGKPASSAGTGKLGVIKRPDGTRQLTDNGRPLYTFTQDSPGKSTGDGFTDAFGGHHFTWHVVHAGGTTTQGAARPQSAPSNTGVPGGY